MMTSRPTALVISQSIPSTTGMGVSMRLGNWVETLSATHDVVLLIVSADPRCMPSELADRWQQLCSRVVFINMAVESHCMEPSPLLRRLTHWAPQMWERWPLQAIREAMSTHLANLAPRQFDAVLVFRLRLWPVWQAAQEVGFASRRLVIDLDDVESMALLRQVRTLGTTHFGRLGSVLAYLDVWRLQRAQRQVLAQADAMTLASPIDKDRLGPVPSHLQGKISVVPNAVRLPQPLPMNVRPEVPGRPLKLLFLGALDYMPNEQAVRWWQLAIRPVLIREMGSAAPQLKVVGRAPPAWMQTTDDLELHANVPSVEPYFKECDALVVPLLSGGGTRIKILEAMAFARPVISTSVGAEGLGAIPGRDYLEANTPDEFVQALVALQENPNLATELVANGLKLVHSNFSLEAASLAMDQVITGRSGA